MTIVQSDAVADQRLLSRILSQMATATNQTFTYGGSNTPTAILTSLTVASVGTTQTTIAHGMGFIPRIYSVVMTSTGTIWQSAVPDATNIYLTASAAGSNCIVLLGY